MTRNKETSLSGRIFHYLIVGSGAGVLALAFFLVLPLMQTIGEKSKSDLLVSNVSTAELEPPPPTKEEEPPEEPPEEEKPPELADQPQRIELSQLEMELNKGLGGSGVNIGSSVKLMLKTIASDDGSGNPFSISDLDQKPRIISQPSPRVNSSVRRKAPGRVNIIFIVNKNGRVENAKVQNSSDPVFERPALAAVKKWKFEPGKRSGKPVRFRMRVPVIFPEGL